ncbi:MAG: hypothetical protein ACRDRT_06585, partial [Pseudonocardiaceae bacterium]
MMPADHLSWSMVFVGSAWAGTVLVVAVGRRPAPARVRALVNEHRQAAPKLPDNSQSGGGPALLASAPVVRWVLAAWLGLRKYVGSALLRFSRRE